MSDKGSSTDRAQAQKLAALGMQERLWVGVSELSGQVPGAVAMFGPAGSGRSTMLGEISRRLREDHGSAIVPWRIAGQALCHHAAAIRAVLSAIIEEVPDSHTDGVMQRWRQRVWLGDRSPATDDDHLVSGLVFAGHPHTEDIDQHVLVADLRFLRGRFPSAAAPVVTIDDADDLCEDVEMVERLVDALNAAGWSVVIMGTPAILRFFHEARSSLLRRIKVVPLRPLSPNEIRAILKEDEQSAERLPEARKLTSLAIDVGRLTGGRPALVRTTARALRAEAVRRGPGTRVELSTAVLRRVLAEVVGSASHGTGIRGLHGLSVDDLERSLKIVPFHQMTVNEIAMCRALGLVSRHSHVDLEARASTDERACDGVRTEIADLGRLGLLTVDEGDTFRLLGGSAAQLFFETAARELLERSVSELPFAESFLELAGGAIARAAIGGAVAARGGGQRLTGPHTIGSQELGSSARDIVDDLSDGSFPRVGELGLVSANDLPATEEALLWSPSGAPSITVACSVSQGDRTTDVVEIWRMSAPVDRHEMTGALLDSAGEAQRLLAECGLRWGGASVHAAGPEETSTLVAGFLPQLCFNALVTHYQSGEIEASLRPASAAVCALKRSGEPRTETEKAEAAEAFNRRGFLQLAIGNARGALEDFREAALVRDGWLVRWNAALALFLESDTEAALAELETSSTFVAHGLEQGDTFMQGLAGSTLIAFYIDHADSRALRELVEVQKRLAIDAAAVLAEAPANPPSGEPARALLSAAQEAGV